MTAALSLQGICAGYGPTVVLDDINFTLPPGRTVALLGRNGVGKTTLLETAMGLTTLHSGHIFLAGESVNHLKPFQRQHLGLALVPQEREIFRSLTVEENLQVSTRPGGWTIDDIYTLFPNLSARRRNGGGQLSGGEQQMLALGRALCGAPKVLLLDEPTEGVAPIVVDAIADALIEIRRSTPLGIVVAEPKVDFAYAISDEILVLDRGRIIFRAKPSETTVDRLQQQVFGHAADEADQERT